MFPRPRFALLCLTLFLCDSSALSEASAQEGAPVMWAQAPAPTSGADRVYRYRGADGREKFTNAGAVAVGGSALAPVELPELHAVDFAHASRTQLQQLDRSVQQAHDELQTGQRCQAIRASLRIPASTFLWREHPRELAVAIALLACALIVFTSWSGRLRGLMPVAPLLAGAYLGYATYARIEHRMDALRDGLHACSSDLPAPSSADPNRIKGRLESAASLQSTVDRAFAQRAMLADRIMSER